MSDIELNQKVTYYCISYRIAKIEFDVPSITGCFPTLLQEESGGRSEETSGSGEEESRRETEKS